MEKTELLSKFKKEALFIPHNPYEMSEDLRRLIDNDVNVNEYLAVCLFDIGDDLRNRDLDGAMATLFAIMELGYMLKGVEVS